MGTPAGGKPDASAFLELVGDYHVGVYGRVEVVRARLRPGVIGTDPEVRAALKAWGGQAWVDDAPFQPEIVLVRPVAAAPDRWALYVGMFLLTLLTTMAAGAFHQDLDPVGTRFLSLGGLALPYPTRIDLRTLWIGASFALPFLAILFCHEAGHYVAARKHRIPVTPPFFIPFPPWFSIVGTLGAFIRIKGPTVRRTELLDVAVAGPLASFLLSIPALLIGLSLSRMSAVPAADVAAPFMVGFAGSTIRLGDGVLLHACGSLMFGESFGSAPIFLHPLAFAGWLGLFVTALNLMPLGQLDGGHILYGLFRHPGQEWAARAFLLVLIPLGWFWWGWWLWGIGALAVNRGRLRHPPVLLPNVPLPRGRRLLGWFAILIFFLTFVPMPLAL